MIISRYYEAPCCGAEVEFAPEDKLKFCRDCGALLELDADAEFLDGTWHDLSQLLERKPERERNQ
jgi:hypothetical protein